MKSHRSRSPFFNARVHDLISGRFLLALRVQAATLKQAETCAISKAALCTRGHPAEMDVRHLHQTTP